MLDFFATVHEFSRLGWRTIWRLTRVVQHGYRGEVEEVLGEGGRGGPGRGTDPEAVWV